MPKKRVGLYLGTSSVGIALQEGKSPLALKSSDLSSVEAKESETFDETLHWQALIRKVFQQTNVEGKEVYLSLADRDFIVRSLELPLMSKSEIKSALIYEVEKYIPFKPEELVWDYQYDRVPKEKKVRVSFVGIRRSGLARTKRVLHNIDLEEVAIEPACLSLIRVLKSAKKVEKGQSFALLDLTSKEAYLTFFQNDLPVFNRYLSVKEKESGLDLDSFTEAVSFSFQYFRREFKGISLDKIFVLTSEPGLEGIASSLEESLSLTVEKIAPADLFSNQDVSLESLKALGCALRPDYPYKFKPVLQELGETKEAEAAAAGMVDWRWPLLIKVAVLAVVAYVVPLLLFRHNLNQLESELERKEKALPLTGELEHIGWRNIDTVIQRKRSRIREVGRFLKEDATVSDLLKVVSQRGVMPSSVWLEGVRLNRASEGMYRGEIRGYTYRGNDYQERQDINDFVTNLRQQETMRTLFNSVELSSTSRRTVRDFRVTEFFLNLR